MVEFKSTGKFFLQLFLVLAVTYLLSNFIGLSRGGFESTEILSLQTSYLVAIAYAIMLISGKLYQISSKEGDSKFGDSVGFASLGEKPHVGFFKRFTSMQIGFLSFIFFSIIALLNMTLVGQKSYTGVGFLHVQQF